MIERLSPRLPPLRHAESIAAVRPGRLIVGGAALLSAIALMGCGPFDDDEPDASTGGMPSTGGAGATAGLAGTSGGVAGAGTGGVAGAAGAGAGGVAGAAGAGAGAGGGGGIAAGGAAGDSAGLGGLAGSAGAAGAGAGGVAGQSGSAGAAGDPNLPPLMLSDTGLFTARGTAPGELVLGEGVREFEPAYWLWSDGADKKRYVYLPPGAQIDTTDPDHWVFPLGTKLWKSFISNGQLVETRLLERIGDEPNEFRYATYYWSMPDSTDALREDYIEQRLDAAGTTHDIPSGQMCERCHNALEDHALGFSALQLNHDRPGVTLQILLDEDLLTVPIATSIAFPGSDQATKDALGYFHANCGNCHNDSPGLPLDSVPAPQMFLRALVADQTLQDSDVFVTAINQPTTASAELGLDYRILGGDELESATYHRMNLRMSEGDQMPPIGSEIQDPDGLAAMASWIQSLPPP